MSDLKTMIEAVKQGDFERVRAMLESDERLANHRDESGATPLHYAALNGYRQIVQMLLERGADINSADRQFGATPAGWAIEFTLGELTVLFRDAHFAAPFRAAAIALSSVYLIGAIAVIFAPETKGRPLPEE